MKGFFLLLTYETRNLLTTWQWPKVCLPGCKSHDTSVEKLNYRRLFKISLRIGLPNITSLLLPVPEILGGTVKILGVTWQGHAPFSQTIITSICLAFPVKRTTTFYIRIFTRSWDIRGYPKNFGSDVTRATPIFRKKIITGVCLAYPCEYAHQILHS